MIHQQLVDVLLTSSEPVKVREDSANSNSNPGNSSKISVVEFYHRCSRIDIKTSLFASQVQYTRIFIRKDS